MAAVGRNRNSRSGVRNGNKQTFVHGVCQRQPPTEATTSRIRPQFRHGAARLIFSFRIPPRKPKTPSPRALNACLLADAPRGAAGTSYDSSPSGIFSLALQSW